MKQEQNPQPIYISVSQHAEFCLTSCGHGRLLSHVLQQAEAAGIVKEANYSIMERKHFLARGMQVYSIIGKGISSNSELNILQHFYRRCFLH